MQAGKVFTVFCGILSAHHSEIPHLRKAQPLHAGWSSLPAQAFDFDGETVIPIGNGNSSAHLTVPRSSHSAHEREQQQFLPWNQIHNPEARGGGDWISGGGAGSKEFPGKWRIAKVVIRVGLMALTGQDCKAKEITGVS